MLVKSLILILVSICLVRSVTYFVGPGPIENETCTLNDSITLTPCFTISQLNQILLSESSVILLLLPGRHVVPANHAVSAFNLSTLAIRPWNDSEPDVEIECRVPAHFIFLDIGEVNISFLTFNACSLRCANSNSMQQSLYTVQSCMFVNRGTDQSLVTSNEGQLTLLIKTCKFVSNVGAVHSLPSIAPQNHRIVIVDSQFFTNMRAYGHGYGGSLLLRSVTLELHQCQFIGNTATSGGAINTLDSVVLVVGCTFRENYARESGGAIFAQNSHVEVYNSKFHSNSAEAGGALYFDGLLNTAIATYFRDFSFQNTTFISNTVEKDGGALYCKGITDGAKVRAQIHWGHSKFNTAKKDGGFAYLSRCDVSSREFNITNNNASVGGAIYVRESVLTFGTTLPNSISHNTAVNAGGALYLQKSQMKYWPGPPFNDGPVIILEQNVVTAGDGRGGAIFVLDSSCEEITSPDNQCFFEYAGGANIPTRNAFFFIENRASFGSALYGGILDRCITLIQLSNSPTPIEIFTHMSYFEQGPLAITSEPLKVCICGINLKPNCSIRALSFGKSRGQSVSLPVAAVDQAENPIPSIISASYSETLSAQLKQGERSQETIGRCTELKYHIFTQRFTEAATLVLEPSENPCGRSQLSLFSIHIAIEPCSIGFEQEGNTCVCDKRLTKHFGISSSSCSVDDQTVEWQGPIWLRYDEKYLMVHVNCPLDYCQVAGDTSISFSFPDDQCANNRSGVLCGACQRNYSLALGGSKCKDCTSSYAFVWLTVLLAVAGLALVALLLVCNITISAGTLNGLIFYANVVSTSGLTSLYNCSAPILSVFIAWVNLELGVETCFYSGMDTYQKTWLQFVFPLYIWLLVGAIIVSSYYSSRAMRVFGRNNIAILATLFLLSYSKLLKTIVTALSFTQVWRGAADNVSDSLVPFKVWTHDGNIEYLKGQHVALFVVAFLVLVLLFLPYTLLLLVGQCVRHMTVRRRSLQWIHSTAFISIMDAYHAPYNRRHRYWTGLMLITRCVLFLVFATNFVDDDIRTNMFSVTLVIIGILIIKTRLPKVYKNIYIDLLEVCFLLNLVILSATVYYLDGISSNGVLCKIVSSSIAVSLIMFLGILVYHALLQIRKTKFYTLIKQSLLRRRQDGQQHHTIPVNSKPDLSNKFKPPTTTTVDLREPLLESTN